jgi:hypothetical protein
METVRITREELYEQVWSEPIHLLAPRYGISGVALAKRCKRLRVPVPGRGFWAKKTAGKPIRVAPLPKLPASAVPYDYVATFRLDQPTTPLPDVPAIIRRLIEIEGAAESQIVVSDSLHSAHSLVLRTRDALKANVGVAGCLFSYQEPHLDIQVSRDSLQRSLLIMDALVKAFERREWKVSTWSRSSNDDRKSYVTVLGQRVPFGIRERLKKVPYDVPGKKAAYLDQRHQEVLSGRLALVLRSRWGNSVEQSWSDTDNRRVEHCLNEFMLGIVERAYADLIWDAEREDSERTRQAAAVKEDAEKRRRDVQLARIATLEQQAADFKKAEALAAFIGAVSKAAETAPLGDAERLRFEEWLSWATAHAGSLNPLTRPVAEVLGPGQSEN